MVSDNKVDSQAVAIATAVQAALGSAETKHRLTALEDRMARMEDILVRTEAKLAEIEITANRWRGGLIVLIALGSIISWGVSTWAGFTRGIGAK